jgi:hypothetical protein
MVDILPTNKTTGEIITVLLSNVDGNLTIVPGASGSIVGSNIVGAGLQRVIYIRFTNVNVGSESYIVY